MQQTVRNCFCLRFDNCSTYTGQEILRINNMDFSEICNFSENTNNIGTKFEVLSAANIEVMPLRRETPSSVVCRCQLVAICRRQSR
jgi:hypothetical protein